MHCACITLPRGFFSKSHIFGGRGYFWDFRGVNVKFSVLTPKRHFLIRKDIYRCISWNSPISGVGCTLVEEPQKVKKMPSRTVYVGCLPESDPLCKCHETWHGGSCQVRNRSDCCWSTLVNRFRCVATPKLSPCHRQGPSGLLQLFPLPRERMIGHPRPQIWRRPWSATEKITVDWHWHLCKTSGLVMGASKFYYQYCGC